MENTCKECQCRNCKSEECPVKCKANFPCMAPVTKCSEDKK
jgi:hypothetical protein